LAQLYGRNQTAEKHSLEWNENKHEIREVFRNEIENPALDQPGDANNCARDETKPNYETPVYIDLLCTTEQLVFKPGHGGNRNFLWTPGNPTIMNEKPIPFSHLDKEFALTPGTFERALDNISRRPAQRSFRIRTANLLRKRAIIARKIEQELTERTEVGA
jgi:hypothetical protein